jgi:hypothetical protein
MPTTCIQAVRQYCTTCYSYYYACPGCQCAICDCPDMGCICDDGHPLAILDAYLEDFEIPEAIKEKNDAE